MNPELGMDCIALLPVAFKQRRNKVLALIPNLFAHSCDKNTEPYIWKLFYIFTHSEWSLRREKMIKPAF
jgi:hypothetical protein